MRSAAGARHVGRALCVLYQRGCGIANGTCIVLHQPQTASCVWNLEGAMREPDCTCFVRGDRPGSRAVLRATMGIALALTLLQGCASGSGRTTRSNTDEINPSEIDELRKTGVRDLYELISRARPRWLQLRSMRSLQLETLILVYVNETRHTTRRRSRHIYVTLRVAISGLTPHLAPG
jgi:hypothetical protein